MSFLLNPMTGVYVLAALIPAAVLLFYVYRHDKIEKEPPKLLLLLLLGGVLAIPPPSCWRPSWGARSTGSSFSPSLCTPATAP